MHQPNGIDILNVRQKTGASTWATVSSFTYDGTTPPHRPKTMTDGAGRTTTYTGEDHSSLPLHVQHPRQPRRRHRPSGHPSDVCSIS
ncbi:MAG: hypothetical protein IPG45_18200 [Deltaproteobacteria bacterium]|nr:hypothetical protein [Deltaproteobacteria bacterium]